MGVVELVLIRLARLDHLHVPLEEAALTVARHLDQQPLAAQIRVVAPHDPGGGRVRVQPLEVHDAPLLVPDGAEEHESIGERVTRRSQNFGQ